MNNIYNKQNILLNLQKVKKILKNLYGEEYSIYEIISGFNALSSKYQDLLLKIDKDENDRPLMKYIYTDMREGAKKAKLNKVGKQNIIIKNPEFKKETDNANDLKNKNLEKSKRIIARSLIEKNKIDINEIIDALSNDEKEIALYKFADRPFKSDIEVSSKFGVDVDEVITILNKVYNNTLISYEKKLVLKNGGSNIE